jgi:hypothetical protein
MGGFRSGASPHRIHHAITGFDGKAAAILLKDLKGWDRELPDDYIGKATETMALVASFAVLADNYQG